jgi:hypothetical protein
MTLLKLKISWDVSIFCVLTTFIDVLSNDPIGTLTYYVFYGVWYFLCWNISGLSGTPDKVGVRNACLQGIHNELLYAFDYEYKNPVF